MFPDEINHIPFCIRLFHKLSRVQAINSFFSESNFHSPCWMSRFKSTMASGQNEIYPGLPWYTVNSEIFVRVLFSWNFAYAKFRGICEVSWK